MNFEIGSRYEWAGFESFRKFSDHSRANEEIADFIGNRQFIVIAIDECSGNVTAIMFDGVIHVATETPTIRNSSDVWFLGKEITFFKKIGDNESQIKDMLISMLEQGELAYRPAGKSRYTSFGSIDEFMKELTTVHTIAIKKRQIEALQQEIEQLQGA